jgi:hypothetical protein
MYRMYCMPVLQEQKPVTKRFKLTEALKQYNVTSWLIFIID